MKRIEAIIRPSKLEEVKEALNDVGIAGMTVSETKGFGRTGGRKEVYRGSAYVVDFVPKVLIEIVAPDDLVASVIEAVLRSAKTGKLGDGKIFVSSSATQGRPGGRLPAVPDEIVPSLDPPIARPASAALEGWARAPP